MQPQTRRSSAAQKLPLSPGAVPRIPEGKTARLIVATLRQDPSRGYTTNEILQALRWSKTRRGTLSKELCRLLKPGQDDTPPPVQRLAPGLYAAFVGPDELRAIENPKPAVHALQLTWRAAGLPQNGGSPPRSRARTHARGAVLEAGFGALRANSRQWVRVEASRSWQTARWVEGLKVTLQVYPTTGTVLASVNSSNSPMDAATLGKLRVFLEATFQAEELPWMEPRVVSVEINRDYERVRLAGREAARFYLGRMGLKGERNLTLGHLEGALVQIYNKDALGVMREEIRLQPRDLDLSNLQAILATMFYGALPPQEQQENPGGYA